MRNIPLFKVFMSSDVIKNLEPIMYSGYVGQGKEVENFEKDLSNYIGNPNCITTNSATSALHLALRLIDVQGKPVISSPLTSPATNMAIALNGGKIIWADVNPLNGNMDPKSLRVPGGLAAIVCVDWGGVPCEIGRLQGFGVPVIEDASQAFGAEYLGKKVGHMADYTVFSFQAIKTVTSVDGGALFLKDKFNVPRAKCIRWYGIDRERMHDTRDEGNIMEYGDKIHMNNVNASIGRSNLVHVDDLLSIARSNAEFFTKEIRNLHADIAPPRPPTGSNPTWWQYQLLIRSNRDDFISYLRSNGIGADIVNTRNDNHYCFRESRTRLPNLDYIDDKRVCIPVGWWVTPEDREYILETIKKWNG